MTPVQFIGYHQNEEQTRKALPGASTDEAMYFASTEYDKAASENTYLQQQIIKPSKSPKSPT